MSRFADRTDPDEWANPRLGLAGLAFGIKDVIRSGEEWQRQCASQIERLRAGDWPDDEGLDCPADRF